MLTKYWKILLKPLLRTRISGVAASTPTHPLSLCEACVYHTCTQGLPSFCFIPLASTSAVLKTLKTHSSSRFSTLQFVWRLAVWLYESTHIICLHHSILTKLVRRSGSFSRSFLNLTNAPKSIDRIHSLIKLVEFGIDFIAPVCKCWFETWRMKMRRACSKITSR